MIAMVVYLIQILLQQSDQAIWIQRRSLSAVHVCPGTTTACAHSAGPILKIRANLEAQSPKWAVNKHLKSSGKMRSKGSKTQTVPFASLHCLKIIESFSIPICFKYFQIVIRVKVVNTNRKSSALEVGRKKVTCYSFSFLFTFSFHIFQFHSFTVSPSLSRSSSHAGSMHCSLLKVCD